MLRSTCLYIFNEAYVNKSWLKPTLACKTHPVYDPSTRYIPQRTPRCICANYSMFFFFKNTFCTDVYFISFYYAIFHNLFTIMTLNQLIIKILTRTRFIEIFFWNILKIKIMLITNIKHIYIFFENDVIRFIIYYKYL